MTKTNKKSPFSATHSGDKFPKGGDVALTEVKHWHDGWNLDKKFKHVANPLNGRPMHERLTKRWGQFLTSVLTNEQGGRVEFPDDHFTNNKFSNLKFSRSGWMTMADMAMPEDKPPIIQIENFDGKIKVEKDEPDRKKKTADLSYERQLKAQIADLNLREQNAQTEDEKNKVRRVREHALEILRHLKQHSIKKARFFNMYELMAWGRKGYNEAEKLINEGLADETEGHEFWEEMAKTLRDLGMIEESKKAAGFAKQEDGHHDFLEELKKNITTAKEAAIAEDPYSKYDAVFLGWQAGINGKKIPLYNITKPGHPNFGSTVSVKTLEREGLSYPPAPSY